MVPPCYRNVQRFALSLAPRLALILVRQDFAGPITSRIPALLGGHDSQGSSLVPRPHDQTLHPGCRSDRLPPTPAGWRCLRCPSEDKPVEPEPDNAGGGTGHRQLLPPPTVSALLPSAWCGSDESLAGASKITTCLLTAVDPLRRRYGYICDGCCALSGSTSA